MVKRIGSVVMNHLVLSFRKLQNNSEREIYNLVDYLNVICVLLRLFNLRYRKEEIKQYKAYINPNTSMHSKIQFYYIGRPAREKLKKKKTCA